MEVNAKESISELPTPRKGENYSPQVSKPSSQREEYRRYLEKSGVFESISKALAYLYEEDKIPAKPKQYFLNRLMSGVPAPIEIESLRDERDTLQKQVSTMKEISANMEQRITAMEERQKRKALEPNSSEPPPNPDAVVVLEPEAEGENEK